MIYVLFMIFSTASHHGGIGIVQQEFTSLSSCESARIAMAKAHSGDSAVLRAHGCFAK